MATRFRSAFAVLLVLLGSVAVVVSASSQAEASNPCAAKAQNDFPSDVMYGQDPSLGCNQVRLSYEYWAGSTAFVYEGVFYYAAQGQNLQTYSHPQLSRGRACTSNAVSPACSYTSGWWNHSNWTTFG